MEGFSINRREYISFEVEGYTLKALVRRPTSNEQSAFVEELIRLQRKYAADDIGGANKLITQLYLDYCSVLVLSIGGVNAEDPYPTEPSLRRDWLDKAGSTFVFAIGQKISESGLVSKETEGK